jgi:hypothetical protein
MKRTKAQSDCKQHSRKIVINHQEDKGWCSATVIHGDGVELDLITCRYKTDKGLAALNMDEKVFKEKRVCIRIMSWNKKLTMSYIAIIKLTRN